MVEVKLNKSNNNPFYGLRNCLTLLQNIDSSSINDTLLDKCYNEVKDDKEKLRMFYSLVFSVGDITARQHNIFKGIKKDSGGNANREGFYKAIMWMKEKHWNQFCKFLHAGIFNEYSCFDMLFRSRVKTKGSKVLEIYDIFEDTKYRKELVKFVYSIVKGANPFNKFLVAKFLTLPRLTVRSKHSKMLPETKLVMEHKAYFLIELSKEIGWEYEANGAYTNFIGYRKWRQEYNKELESVLFSSGKIKEFDKQSFLTWFDKLPAQARYRVKNRVLYSKDANEALKYPTMKTWYEEWEKYKADKQKEQRVLEEKVRQGQASEDDKIKLEKVKKEAKVTVGATNFKDIYNDILNGKVDALKVESFMNKVNLPYNSLVIIDDSGSMRGAPFNFASFIAAACLVKNPDDDGRNLLGFFNGHSHWHSYIDSSSCTRNFILRTEVAKINKEPFVKPELSFIENYKRIKSFCDAVFQSGCTNISGIPEGLYKMCKLNPAILDALRSYPVWTIISD